MKPICMFLVCWLLMVATLTAQRTWRVNCAGGPNTDFTDLPPAIAAASPGDTIWVIFGPQPCPTNPFYYSLSATINKPLTIVGVTSYGTPGYNEPLFIPTAGKLEITSIPTGQRVVISNIGISIPPFTTQVPPHGIHAVDCGGEILLETMLYRGQGVRGSVMRFERCSNVTLRGCTFRLSGEAVTLIDSTMTITNTWLYWSYPLPQWVPQAYWYTQVGPGLWVRNSNATVIASVIDGPNATSYFPSHVGAAVESGTLTVGPFSLLRGGWGYAGQNIRDASFWLPNPPAAQVYVDSRAQPLTWYWGPPPVIPRTVHAAYHDFVVAGETYHVSVAGPPNGWALMAVGSAAIQPSPLPGLGLLALEPASIAILGLQALDGVGWAEWTQACPANVPIGHVFAFQAGVIAPNGAISLVLPSPFTVGWPNGQIP